MCGRFSLHLTDLGEVGARFGVAETAIEGWQARYNIAPSQEAPVVLERGVRRLELLEWGLIPYWTREPGGGRRPINARAESAADLPSFRDALRSRRCIVPATGYYEWRLDHDGKKQPMWIADSSGELLALAGLWQEWQSPEGAQRRTFAILTTDAHGAPAEVHDRMPLQVPPSRVDSWLSAASDGPALLAELLPPSSEVERLVARPVCRLVNTPANDGPECLEPAPEPGPTRQLGLFGDG
jgi:putative SOS response-associated peptidase YedK